MAQPSLIPVPISKRTSVSLHPSVLQQSTNSVNSAARSPSPLANSTTSKNNKRLSLANGHGLNGSSSTNGNGNGNGRKNSTETEDPALLKARISKLEGALQAAHARMTEDCRASGIDASMSLSSPTSGSPLPCTPTNGTLRLPELGTTPGDLSEDERLDSVSEEPVTRLVKSNSNFDLRTAAATPKESRGLGRIPRAAVHNTLSLHDSPKSPLSSPHAESPNAFGQGSPSLYPSAGRKASGSSASTKVIDSLQTELLNTKVHLEKVKSNLRGSQRIIASLGRETEDLKETRERLRKEVETAQNLTSRKERMLAEVLERAQKAESQAATLSSNQRELEQSTKKSLAEMSTQLAEAQRDKAKAESECNALKNSVGSMKESWAREVKSLRAEIKKADEGWKQERDDVLAKNAALLKLVQDQSERTSVLALLDKSSEQNEAAREALESEIGGLRDQVDKSAEETKQALNIANELQAELARLRRFMREPSRAHDEKDNDNKAEAEPKREDETTTAGQEKESA